MSFSRVSETQSPRTKFLRTTARSTCCFSWKMRMAWRRSTAGLAGYLVRYISNTGSVYLSPPRAFGGANSMRSTGTKVPGVSPIVVVPKSVV